MKIDPHHQFGAIRHSAAHSRPTGDATFKKLFDQALDKAPPTTVEGDATLTAGSASSADLAMGNASWERSAVERFESLLDALAGYQERLGNGRVSLRSLEQDLDRIGGHCNQLDALARRIAKDSAVQPLLEEGLAAARTEIERFYRGDYC
jgi:hypothetical protein